MAEWESDIRAAIEARAKKARPVGQVVDRSSPLKPADAPIGNGRATRFVLVTEDEEE